MSGDAAVDQQTAFAEALAPDPNTPAETPEQKPPPPEPPTKEPEPPAEKPETEATIPSWRLREEADNRRAAEQRAQALERRLTELEGRQRQAKEQEEAPDWFTNPEAAMGAALAKYLAPVFESQHKANMHNSKLIAQGLHGREVVNEAEAAFYDAATKGLLAPGELEAVRDAPNRYDAAVQWHEKQKTLTTVGKDPQAWFQAQLDAKLADPKFQTELLEKVRGGAATRPGKTVLPPSLSGKTSAASSAPEVVGDLSNDSLWSHARPQK